VFSILLEYLLTSLANIKFLNQDKFSLDQTDYSEKHSNYIIKVYELIQPSDINKKKNILVLTELFQTMTVDCSIIKIICNLNSYEISEMKLVYKIVKNFIQSSKFLQKVNHFLIENIQNLVEALLENIRPSNKIKSDSVVFIVGKLFRAIFKQNSLLEKVLSLEFFSELYYFMKSEKFVVSNEAFKTIQVRNVFIKKSLFIHISHCAQAKKFLD